MKRTFGLVLAAALAMGSALIAAPPAPAGATAGWLTTGADNQSVRVFLRAGDAHAVAQCLNIAEHNQRAVNQNNRCTNVVQAKGGDLVILGADITALQTSDGTIGSTNNSNVAFTAQAGNATAIAQCVNTSFGQHTHQTNRCLNIAVATGGTIVLINVNVTGVQLT